MVTITPRVSCSSAAALGRSTSAAGFTMAEVVIMKMMSSTRKTSVSGVTLISATMWPRVWALPNAMGPPPGGHRLEDAGAADAQRRIDALHAVLQVFVEHQRHDADREPERGGDQRLRDAAGDHAEAAGAGEGHAVEGADDAEHRAE